MKRLELKVSFELGKAKGVFTLMEVYEIADSLNLDINKKQATKLLKKAKDNYGY